MDLKEYNKKELIKILSQIGYKNKLVTYTKYKITIEFEYTLKKPYVNIKRIKLKEYPMII